MSQKVKVSRAGKILGDFSKEEVLEGLSKGTLLPTDYIWDPENKSDGWQKLSTLGPLAASGLPPPAPASTPARPPTAPAQAKQVPEKPKVEDWSGGKTVRFILGVILILAGALNALGGAAGDPTGSAIRQAVLTQQVTNGLLLMIFGLLLARK